MEEKIVTEPGKQIRKEGITYYLCQHLEEGLMKFEDSTIWLGDKRRVILCPLCNKMEFGNQIMYSYALRGMSEKKLRKLWKGTVDIIIKRVRKNWDEFTK